MAITFVGATIRDTHGSMSLPSGMQEGDIVFLMRAVDGGSLPAISGWTNRYDVTSSNPVSRVDYKVMGASPDATVTIPGPQGEPFTTIFPACIAYALRGVDIADIFDVANTVATGGSGDPDPPSITTVTNGAAIIAFGFLDDDTADVSAAPSTYGNLAEIHSSSGAGTSCTVMAAWKEKTTAGADNPGAFVTSGDDAWEAVCIAVKPLASGSEELAVAEADGTSTVDGAGGQIIYGEGAAAGIATADAVGEFTVDPNIHAEGVSDGIATVFGIAPGRAAPFADAEGTSTAFAFPLSYISQFRYGTIEVPNFRYGTEQVERIYYNGNLVFRHVIATQGVAMAEGSAAVEGVGGFTVPPALVTLMDFGFTGGDNQLVHTINNVDLGPLPPEGTKRHMVLVAGAAETDDVQILSAKLTGVGMSLLVSNAHTGSDGACVGAFMLLKPTEELGNIEITFSEEVDGVCWAMYRVRTFDEGVDLVDVNVSTPGVDPAVMSVAVNKGGGVIGAVQARGGGDPPSYVWTGVENPALIDPFDNDTSMGVAHKVVPDDTSAFAVTADCTTGDPNRICAILVSIGP